MASLETNLPEISVNKRMLVSDIIYERDPPALRTYHSNQFIPFCNERDNMGRLLSRKSQYQKIYSQNSFNKVKFSRFHEVDLTPKQIKTDNAIDFFFKKIDVESKELVRTTFSPKKPLIIVSKQKINHIQAYDLAQGLDKIKEKTKSCIIKPSCSIPKSNKSPSLINNASSITIMKNSQIQAGNHSKAKSTHQMREQGNKKLKKSFELLESLKGKVSLDNPQMRRYRQKQAMSLKIFPDYQVGHEKFKQKMKQSKMIAHRIKKQLQLD